MATREVLPWSAISDEIDDAAAGRAVFSGAGRAAIAPLAPPDTRRDITNSSYVDPIGFQVLIWVGWPTGLVALTGPRDWRESAASK